MEQFDYRYHSVYLQCTILESNIEESMGAPCRGLHYMWSNMQKGSKRREIGAFDSLEEVQESIRLYAETGKMFGESEPEIKAVQPACTHSFQKGQQVQFVQDYQNLGKKNQLFVGDIREVLGVKKERIWISGSPYQWKATAFQAA